MFTSQFLNIQVSSRGKSLCFDGREGKGQGPLAGGHFEKKWKGPPASDPSSLPRRGSECSSAAVPAGWLLASRNSGHLAALNQLFAEPFGSLELLSSVGSGRPANRALLPIFSFPVCFSCIAIFACVFCPPRFFFFRLLAARGCPVVCLAGFPPGLLGRPSSLSVWPFCPSALQRSVCLLFFSMSFVNRAEALYTVEKRGPPYFAVAAQ